MSKKFYQLLSKMKPILILLLLLLSLSCFAQENDRATIVKNKVRLIVFSGISGHAQTDTTYTYYNDQGFIDYSYINHYSNPEIKSETKYYYKDTQLIRTVKSVTTKELGLLTDTTLYLYDKIDRLVKLINPFRNKRDNSGLNHEGVIIEYYYKDSISKEIEKEEIFNSNLNKEKCSCKFRLWNGVLYYLSEYKIYEYKSNNLIPTKYCFLPELDLKGNATCIFTNTYIEGLQLTLSDSIYQILDANTCSSLSINKGKFPCDLNNVKSIANDIDIVELNTFLNSKLIYQVNNKDNKSKRTIFYKDNGLIDYVNKVTYYDGEFGTKSRFSINVLYEYYQ